MKHCIPALIFAAACLAPAVASAQTTPTDIYVSVVDGKGDPATGLTAQDFRVSEDGTTREVLKAGPATEPLTVALLVDDSQAASGSTQMIREALEGFITALAGKAEISIVTFGDRPTIAVDYTTDQKKLLEAAKRFFPRAGSGAYLMDALVEVSRGMEKRHPKRAVIAVLTIDDEIEFSNQHFETVLEALDRGGASLNVVTMGTPSTSQTDEVRNRNQVIALGTERTGGLRDNVIAVTAAAPAMKRLARQLLDQYVVTYARPETLIPPKKIDVTVTRPGLTARARTRNPEVGSR